MENFYVIADSPSIAPTMVGKGIIPRGHVIASDLELGKTFSITFEMYSDMIKLFEMRFTVIPAF